jgi:hypothetical protein
LIADGGGGATPRSSNAGRRIHADILTQRPGVSRIAAAIATGLSPERPN